MRAGRRHRAGPARRMRREGPQGRFPCGLFCVLRLSRGRGALYAAYLALRALGAVRRWQLGLRFLGTLRHRVG